MYKEFYGFTTYPFSITPDPQFLYSAKSTKRVCMIYYIALKGAMGLSFSLARLGQERHCYSKYLRKAWMRKHM